MNHYQFSEYDNRADLIAKMLGSGYLTPEDKTFLISIYMVEQLSTLQELNLNTIIFRVIDKIFQK